MEKTGLPSSPDEKQVVQSTYIKPQARLLHDPDITFEEYRYYAKRTREEQDHLEPPKLRWREIINRATHKDDGAPQVDAVPDETIDYVPEIDFGSKESRLHISDEEWSNASRAMRTASCKLAFYCINLRHNLIWIAGIRLQSLYC